MVSWSWSYSISHWCSVPMCSSLFSTFSSISLSVPGFRLRSLSHLDLSFVQGYKIGSFCLLLHVYHQLKQHQFFENIVFYRLDEFSSCVKYQVIIGVWVDLWAFSSNHWSTCPSLYQYHEVFITIALKNSLRSRMVIPPEVVSLLKIVFAIIEFLLFQMNLKMALYNSMKNWIGILMEIVLNL